MISLINLIRASESMGEPIIENSNIVITHDGIVWALIPMRGGSL